MPARSQGSSSLTVPCGPQGRCRTGDLGAGRHQDTFLSLFFFLLLWRRKGSPSSSCLFCSEKMFAETPILESLCMRAGGWSEECVHRATHCTRLWKTLENFLAALQADS